MTNLSFTRDVPHASHNPSSDQPIMEVNNNSIDSILDIDHFGFNRNEGGFHRQVHLKNEAAPGGLGANADGVLYANLATGQSWPFWQNALGSFQLMGQNNIVTPGYLTLPAGLIIQWGTNTSASGATISFPIAFPNNVFSIQTTIFQNTTNRHFVYVRSSTLSDFVTTQLDSGGSGETNTFSWIAIGN